ncbi:MAG: nitroreductase family protein [Pseudomonadota bacterium]
MSDVISRVAHLVKRLARNPVSTSQIVWRIGVRRFQNRLAGPASVSGFTSSLYYTFLSTYFRREQQAVLKGKAAYRRSDIAQQASSSNLRRNIHRLEKGLIMRPRRPVFAEDYIAETVSLFDRASDAGKLDNEEYKWAGDVLSDYFSVVSDSPKIAPARQRFSAIEYQKSSDPSTPYPSDARPQSTITFDEFKTLTAQRRSVRWYRDERVNRADIEACIEIASTAPSACNRQPYSFYIADDPQEATRLAKLAGGTGGFADNIPCLIVIIGDLSCYPEERDRHLIYIDASSASMQLMLALQTKSLSTCSINWPDIESREREMQSALGLEKHERTIMLLAVGVADPDGEIPYSQKKGTNVLLKTRKVPINR